MLQDQQQVQEVYESQPVKSDEIYANLMQEERVKNIIAQTSPDNQLTDIEWRIRGHRKNIYTGQWEKIDGVIEPSSILVGRYISYLGSILNDNTRFTNLSSGQINSLMRLCIEWIVDDMDSHAVQYGLDNDYTERSRVAYIILHATFMVLKRSENGMESRRVWNSLNLNETSNPFGQTKKSWKDMLSFWK
jgi:hypothetical protein